MPDIFPALPSPAEVLPPATADRRQPDALSDAFWMLFADDGGALHAQPHGPPEVAVDAAEFLAGEDGFEIAQSVIERESPRPDQAVSAVPPDEVSLDARAAPRRETIVAKDAFVNPGEKVVLSQTDQPQDSLHADEPVRSPESASTASLPFQGERLAPTGRSEQITAPKMEIPARREANHVAPQTVLSTPADRSEPTREIREIPAADSAQKIDKSQPARQSDAATGAPEIDRMEEPPRFAQVAGDAQKSEPPKRDAFPSELREGPAKEPVTDLHREKVVRGAQSGVSDREARSSDTGTKQRIDNGTKAPAPGNDLAARPTDATAERVVVKPASPPIPQYQQTDIPRHTDQLSPRTIAPEAHLPRGIEAPDQISLRPLVRLEPTPHLNPEALVPGKPNAEVAAAQPISQPPAPELPRAIGQDEMPVAAPAKPVGVKGNPEARQIEVLHLPAQRASKPPAPRILPDTKVILPQTTGGAIGVQEVVPVDLKADTQFPVGSVPVVISLPTVASVASAPPQPAIPPQVAHHMATSVMAAPNGTLDIALHPEELGQLRLVLSSGDSGHALLVTAEREETLLLLRRHEDTLARAFENLGYTGLSLSFEQSGQGGADAQKHDDTPSPAMVPGAVEPDLPASGTTLTTRLDLRL